MEVCLHEDNQRWMDIKGLGDYIKTMLPHKMENRVYTIHGEDLK